MKRKWVDWNGICNCRRMYLIDHYGIEAGYFSQDGYIGVIRSWEFEDMPIWPQEGAVKMIDGRVRLLRKG